MLKLVQAAQNIICSCEQQVCVKIRQGKKYHECEQETVLNYEQYDGKKTTYDDGKKKY